MELPPLFQDFWNIKRLEFPPLSTYKASENDIDIKHLRSVIEEGIQHFQDEKFLRCEYEILCIIVYRMKGKFRTSKDFKSLAKLKQTLRNYYCVKLGNYLENFNGLIPFKSEDREIYLPTKNTLYYLLVRLQGLVKLLERIVTSTKLAAELFHARLRIGHFWKIGLIVFALVSRIYIVTKHHTKFLCELYAKLLPFSSKLRNTSTCWLPKDYNLPQDLKEWLTVDWIDKDNDIIEISEIPRTLDLLNLIEEDDEDDIQFCQEYVLIKDDRETEDIVNRFKKLPKMREVSRVFRGFEFDGDIGEVIEINDNIDDNNEAVDEGNTNVEFDIEDGKDENIIYLSDSECNETEFESSGDEITMNVNSSKIKGKVKDIKEDSCFISLVKSSNTSSSPIIINNKEGKNEKNGVVETTLVQSISDRKICKKRKRKWSTTSDNSEVAVENNKPKSQSLNKSNDSIILNESNVSKANSNKKRKKLKAKQSESDKSVIILENNLKNKEDIRKKFIQGKQTQNHNRQIRKKIRHKNRYYGPKNNLI